MELGRILVRSFQITLIIAVVFSFTASSIVIDTRAAPTSWYDYKFTVDREGFTTTEIDFSSTNNQGSSWVFVPRAPVDWSYTVVKGILSEPSVVETDQVVQERYYFYQAFMFQYQADGTFNMTITFGFKDGAVIIEPRGIFYSPQIGFQSDSDGTAEVILDNDFQVNPSLAVVIGAVGDYPLTSVEGHTRVFFILPENEVRIQVEFSVGFSTPEITVLKSSDNKTFTFNAVTRYRAYAQSILNLYDRIYLNFTRLFNVTLTDVDVQFFLPDFSTLLSVGGFVPFIDGQLGEININVFFDRTVNGTIEVIAAHELVHRFIGKTGISPSDFLWFHEGMAQYISITALRDLGYEGAARQRDIMEAGASSLISSLGGEDFSAIGLQYWTPNYQPSVDVHALYVAAYYTVRRLPEVAHRGGFDYYGRFFKLIRGTQVNDINILALYLSTAANASVALTLQRWGFSVSDLYASPLGELIEQTDRTVQAVNPVFQPYRSLAEYFYRQALLSTEQGDWERAQSFLQISMGLAKLAPTLTFLTILAILVTVAYVLYRRSSKPKPTVPVPPPEILQPPAPSMVTTGSGMNSA